MGLLAEETAYVRQRLHLAVGRVARSLKNKIDPQQRGHPAKAEKLAERLGNDAHDAEYHTLTRMEHCKLIIPA